MNISFFFLRSYKYVQFEHGGLAFPQVTKKEAGSYRAVVSDGRGEDVSTLELLGDGETSVVYRVAIIHLSHYVSLISYPPLSSKSITA